METVCGVMLPVTATAPTLVDLARHSEAAGVDELWIPEDLGLHGGIALATAVLAATERVPVGLGIAPAAARHPAFLAMQAATLGQLYPGRFRLGVGHGMPEWMRSLGIWPTSPLVRLEETLVTVRRLLAGERVTVTGDEVELDGVQLATAPVDVPLYAGVRGPRSLEVAGRAADGVVLAGWAGPAYIREARDRVEATAGRTLRVVASARFAVDRARSDRSAHDRLLADLAQAGASIAAMLVDRSRDAAGSDLAQLLPEVGIAGDLDVLRRGIARWHAAGADVVLLDPLTVDDLEAAIAGGILDGGLD